MIDPHDKDGIVKFARTDPKGATKLILQLFAIMEQKGQKKRETTEARIKEPETQLNKNRQNGSFSLSRDLCNPKQKPSKTQGKRIEITA